MEKELENPNQLKHAKIGIRIGAYLIDMIVVMIPVLPLNYMNITEYKSFTIFLLIASLGILYKPLMEYYYQATLGKLLLDLKVSDLNGKRIDLKQSFMRSLILIMPSILLIPVQYLAFNNPEIVSINSFMDFSKAVIEHYPFQQIISNLISVVLIIDLIFMFTDKQKKYRSLHDRIGKTYVLKTK